MQIEIDKKVSLDDIENYYKRLERFNDVDSIDILLPTTLEYNFMGLVPALYQFVFTWIRCKNSGRLLINIDNPDLVDYAELFENEHLFPIVILAWNRKEIYNNDGKIEIKQRLIKSLAEVRDLMLKVKPMKGKKLLLLSIDHFPPSRGLLPCYETDKGFIDNESNTYRNLKEALNEILVHSFLAKSAFEIFERDFVAIIHELIKNTYEWGRSDLDNVPLDPNVRGVLVKFYKKKRTTFINEFKTHKGIKEYFASKIIKENSVEELYFIEISVFDSGVGFVSKYEQPDKNILNDVQIIKSCLIRHMTSASGLEKNDKGIGLDRMLNLLDNKGFLRIKTHKSCLYRNLISHPYKLVDDENDLELFDWETQSNTEYRSLPQASGSTLTILYPLALNSVE